MLLLCTLLLVNPSGCKSSVSNRTTTDASLSKSGVAVVHSAAALKRALVARAPRIVVGADRLSLDALSVFHSETTDGQTYILPVSYGTEAIVGRSPANGTSVIAANTSATLFHVSPGARLWLHRLSILMVRLQGNEPVAVLSVRTQASVWATELQVALTLHSWQLEESSRWGLDLSTFFAVTEGNGRLYAADCNIVVSEAMVLSARGSSTAAFVRTFVSSGSRHGERPQWRSLFQVEACMADRLRLLQCSFNINCFGFSTVVYELLGESGCIFREPLEDRHPWDGLTWRLLAQLQYSEAGDRICSKLGGEFLTGREFATLWTQLERSERPPEPTSCPVDARHCVHHASDLVPTVSFGVGTATRPMPIFMLVVVGAAAAAAVFLFCRMKLLQLRPPGVGRRGHPRHGIQLQPLFMRESDREGKHVFVPPRDDHDCACPKQQPGPAESCLFCPLCSALFSGVCEAGSGCDRRPRALPCGHSVCATCVSTIGDRPEPSGAKCASAPLDVLPVNYPAAGLLATLPAEADSQPHWTPRSAPSAAFAPTAELPSGELSAGAGLQGPPDADVGPVLGLLSPTRRPGTGCCTAEEPLPRARDRRGSAASPPATALPEGIFNALARSGQSLVSLASSLASSRRADTRQGQRTLRWRPDEEAFFCPICFNALSPTAPAATDNCDRRPVIFPCGHGACAQCASRIRHRKACYALCEWRPEELQAPFPVNQLLVSMMELADAAGGSVVLTMCKLSGQRSGADVSQDLLAAVDSIAPTAKEE